MNETRISRGLILNGMQPCERRLDGELASYAQAYEAAIAEMVMMRWNCHFNEQAAEVHDTSQVHIMRMLLFHLSCQPGPAHLCIRSPHILRGIRRITALAGKAVDAAIPCERLGKANGYAVASS